MVLSGSGNLGAVEVGMLRVLVEDGIVPDVMVGTGALNGTWTAAAHQSAARTRFRCCPSAAASACGMLSWRSRRAAAGAGVR